MTHLKYFIPGLVLCQSILAQEAAPAALTLKDAIQTSLKNNLAVEISRETLKSTRAQLLISEGVFDWTLDSNLSFSKYKRQSGSKPNGPDKEDEGFVYGPDFGTFGPPDPSKKVTEKSGSFKTDLKKAFSWGGDVHLSYSPSYRPSYRVSHDERPPYSGSFGLTYTQQLLKKDINNTQILVARKNNLAADNTFKLEMITLITNTENLYWDVVSAQRNRENKQLALDLAKRQLKETEIKVNVGMLARIELATPEAAVATAEKEIIEAENEYLNAQDALLQALYPKDNRPASFQATDAPPATPVALEEKVVERLALDSRLEIKNAKLEVEQKELLEKEARNASLPRLFATAGYSTSSGDHTALGSVNKDLATSKYPGYTVGLGLSLNIQNRAAKGNLLQKKSDLEKSKLSLKDKELHVALEVRKALRNVIASEKSIQAAEKARQQHQKDVDATQKKYAKGMTTNFEVLSKQKELDLARSAELAAQIHHAKNLTELDRSTGRLLEARGIALQ